MGLHAGLVPPGDNMVDGELPGGMVDCKLLGKNKTDDQLPFAPPTDDQLPFAPPWLAPHGDQ